MRLYTLLTLLILLLLLALIAKLNGVDVFRAAVLGFELLKLSLTVLMKFLSAGPSLTPADINSTQTVVSQLNEVLRELMEALGVKVNMTLPFSP